MTPELRQALQVVGLDQLASVAAGVAEGRVVEIRPSPQEKPAWLLDSGPPDLPGQYKLWRVGEQAVSHGERRALWEELDGRLRRALAPYEGQADVPPWAAACRLAQVALWARVG